MFTPDYLVSVILDQAHYMPGNIIRKHVIDNSCGDGQFMIQIIDRYCRDFLSVSDDVDELRAELETYVHAIEIERENIEACIQRCDAVAQAHNVKGVRWDFVDADTLRTDKFDGKMDFVVGNPPYVRVHNLNENFDEVKSFLFGNGGMTDLYIVFYEKGLEMLNEKGILTYISPSSFFTSLAGSNMRRYLIEHELLESVCDLKHFQPFDATAYTAIVRLRKKPPNASVKYFEFDTRELKPFFVCDIPVQDYYVNGSFYFSRRENLKLLKSILLNEKKSSVCVKNGFATLADDFFVHDFDFESDYVIPVIKASRGKWSKIFYPYDRDSGLVSEQAIKKDKAMYAYIMSNKEKLSNRDFDRSRVGSWFAFGRSQGINDTYCEKIAINSLIRTEKDLKVTDVPAGCGVYGGLYIIAGQDKFGDIKDALKDKDFGVYVSLLGKYKSGGYYTFSTKDVKKYIDFKLGETREDLFNVV